MNIILRVAFTICVCPCVSDIPSQACGAVSTGPVGMSVLPQLSVTVGGVGKTIFSDTINSCCCRWYCREWFVFYCYV